MCHLKKTMDAGLPNERAIGITVGTDICASFSKTGWLVGNRSAHTAFQPS